MFPSLQQPPTTTSLEHDMPSKNAFAAYQQQWEVINAFARAQNAPHLDFAALLEQDHLRSLKPKKGDTKLDRDNPLLLSPRSCIRQR